MRYEPIINNINYEMAEHYNTAIITAIVHKTMEKQNVKGAVGVASIWVLTTLRHVQCFSAVELNQTIRDNP